MAMCLIGFAADDNISKTLTRLRYEHTTLIQWNFAQRLYICA